MYTLPFALEKSSAALYEGFALVKIEDWYRSQALKVRVRYNEENGLEGKRQFDLIDSYGKRWEVKCDRLAGTTGNVFLEHQALRHSEADFFLIFAAGLTFILPREAVLELANGPYNSAWGGDDLRATGTLVPLSALKELAHVV